jgi:fructose-1,6-bisphosphatase/inositol monophosphatase family enzyme
MLIERVAEVMREAAAVAILPRFRRLAEEDIDEKSPGEIVTAADRHAEVIIAAALPSLLPGSRVVGEEACAASPDLLLRLDEGLVWLVDPLDGTSNFASGKQPFSVMIALLRDGEAVISWMLDPLTGNLCLAERGSGATLNGRRLFNPENSGLRRLRGAVLTRFMPEEVRRQVESGTAALEKLPGTLCAGAEYPSIARADRDFAIFWRTLPWDHVPGALLVEEAGGLACRFDGSCYHVALEGFGLVVGRTKGIADGLRSIISD